MHPTLTRRALLRGALALLLPTVALTTRAHEFFTTCLTVIHPWTRASSPDATSAIVSMRFVDVKETDRFIDAETPVAERTELVGIGASETFSFLIPKGRDSELSEDGLHLRLVGLKFPLLLGREYPMTLIFENGGPVKAALLIDFPAQA
jgi:copper(I)-binding protein